jgi:hypothetical protein
MAVTRNLVANAAVGGGTSVGVTNPGFDTTGTTLILAFIESTIALSSVTPPTGFSAIGSSVAATGSAVNLRCYGKVATVSEPGTYTWTFAPASFANVTMADYLGAAPSGVPAIGAFTTRSNGSSSTAAWAGTRVDLDDGALVAAAGLFDNRTPGTVANWTQRISAAVRLHLFDRLDPPMTTTGLSETFTGGSSYNATIMLHLAPVTVPAPVFILRPTITGTPGVGNVLTCVPGTALYAYTQTYQWQRDGVNISGATNATYTQQSADSKTTLTCVVTAAGNTAPAATASTLGVSFYTLTSGDIGHNMTVDVAATNTAGTTTVASSAVTAQFQNTTPPSISGGETTMTASTVLTAVAGVYVETVSTRTYTWITDGTSEVHVGTTFTPGETNGSRRITVREDVTGPGGTGAAVSTAYRIFSTLVLPWGHTASPWYTPLPSDVQVDPAWTTTLQGYLTTQSNNNAWWWNGGNHGAAFSCYFNIVDSSMPRTQFEVVTSGATTPSTATKNGAVANHLAWSFGTKNGGIPTPPGGFKVVPGSDHHLLVYCTDTHECWDCWATVLEGYAHPRCSWGGYIPDITQ